jgi:hypothetical protein
LSYYGFDNISSLSSNQEKNECVGLCKRYGVTPTVNWKDIPFLLRMIIAKYILDLQTQKVQNYDDLINYQKNFIDSYSNNNDTTIISFNYDDVLLDSKINFENGFDANGDLDKNLLDKAKKTIIFPHGHIRFFFYDKDTVKYYDNASQAHKCRWDNLFSIFVDATLTLTIGKKAYTYNTFITTGQHKTNGFNLEPYKTYESKMQLALKQSAELVIVGYSFNDDYVNDMLKLCLAKKITVIDCQKEQNIASFQEKIKEKCGNAFFDSTELYLKGYDKYLEENYSQSTN